MKKVIIMLAAAMVSMGAMAQVQFGAKVGADLTNFWGDEVEHGMKPGYQVGVLMEYKFNDKFAIAPEAVFATQGGKYTEKEDGIKEEITANTNYINVPVMLKYYVAPNFSLDFGPQLGINVYSKFSAKTTGTLAGVTVSEKETIDVKDDTEAIDFGVGLGCTYNLTENAFLQARYTMGLTKVFEDVDGCKNANIQVAFGWKF